MDTSVNLANKRYRTYLKHSLCSDAFRSPATPSAGDKKAARKDGNIVVAKWVTPSCYTLNHSLVCRENVRLEDTELMFPLPPFRQTPGPVSVSQSYLRRLILARWEAEVKGCEHAKKLQLMEIAPGPALTLLQASLRRIIVDRWDAEVRCCEEVKKVQLLELLLAAHGISRLV
jgi:hypothetical protein